MHVDEFSTHLAQLVGDAQSPAVLDLRRLKFFGSTALNAVLEAHERAETRGVQLLIRPSPIALRVIRAARLNDVLKIG